MLLKTVAAKLLSPSFEFECVLHCCHEDLSTELLNFSLHSKEVAVKVYRYCNILLEVKSWEAILFEVKSPQSLGSQIYLTCTKVIDMVYVGDTKFEWF